MAKFSWKLKEISHTFEIFFESCSLSLCKIHLSYLTETPPRVGDRGKSLLTHANSDIRRVGPRTNQAIHEKLICNVWWHRKPKILKGWRDRQNIGPAPSRKSHFFSHSRRDTYTFLGPHREVVYTWFRGWGEQWGAMGGVLFDIAEIENFEFFQTRNFSKNVLKINGIIIIFEDFTGYFSNFQNFVKFCPIFLRKSGQD